MKQRLVGLLVHSDSVIRGMMGIARDHVMVCHQCGYLSLTGAHPDLGKRRAHVIVEGSQRGSNRQIQRM
ncbi:MAG: hypothetical protein OXG05_07725 [Gammaproteobacteria bacterium]|nr:hypothetical protein [Gammaproteobacteria bacterium]